MSKQLATAREIVASRPPDLSQFQGCADAIEYLENHLNNDGQGGNILVEGDPGTGKTSLVHAYVRALVCRQRQGKPPRHCGQCSTCRSFDVQFSDVGLFTMLRFPGEDREDIHYFPVNCGNVTAAQLQSIIEDDRREFPGRFVIALQEAQYLKARSLDGGLLPTLENDHLNILWLADTAHPEKLDPMFLRRFTRITTSPPEGQDLANYLAVKCSEWGLVVDAPETLALLSERSRGVISECIRVLSLAALNNDRRLVRATVEKYSFIVPQTP